MGQASTTSRPRLQPMGPDRNWVPMSPSSRSPSVRGLHVRSTTSPARSWSPISMHPNLAQQQEMLQILMDAKPQGARADLALSDMGWQSNQHETCVRTFRRQRHPEHLKAPYRQRRHRTGLRAPRTNSSAARTGKTFESFSRPQRPHHLLEHTKTPSKAQEPDLSRIPRSGPPNKPHNGYH